jgi:hypothetical protein
MLAAMSTRSLVLSIVLAALTIPSTALAWPTIDPAGHRAPLLGGRWTIALPEGATPGTLGGPPGAATPRFETDGVVVLESPEGHFAVHATLLNATRPTDLEAAVRTLPPPCEAPTFAPLADRTDAVTVRCAAPSPDGTFRPIVVFAVHTDGWVERFEAMIETSDPGDTTARDQAVVFAEAALTTLRAEDVPAAVERGTIELQRGCVSGSDFDAFTLTLPEGWIAMRNEQAGGALLRIMPVVELGAARPTLAASLEPAGTPPSRVPPGLGTLRTSALLGGNVDWLVIEPEGEPQGMRQVAADLTVSCGDEGTFARALRLSAAGPQTSLDEAQRVLETLTLTSARGHHATLDVIPSEQPVHEDADAPPEDGHVLSIAIGGASIALLVVALALRARRKT